jgi:hypothetical protein
MHRRGGGVNALGPLCDLERHRVVDLLPERSASSGAQWLHTHRSSVGSGLATQPKPRAAAVVATCTCPPTIRMGISWWVV